MFSFKKTTHDTNELAKFRNRAAAERTLTSWIQNSLVLMAFGIGFERIFNALHYTFPENNLGVNLQLTYIIGLSLIALSLLLLTLAIFQYLSEIKFLERENSWYQPFHCIHLIIVVGSIILFGLGALIVVYFISWVENI